VAQGRDVGPVTAGAQEPPRGGHVRAADGGDRHFAEPYGAAQRGRQGLAHLERRRRVAGQLDPAAGERPGISQDERDE
jgi:hypothetical protein